MSLVLADEVQSALAQGRPVVALETSILAHGLPAPRNLEAALACERAIREAGAVPATIAVIEGRLRVGLERAELERLSRGGIRKLSSRDLGPALAEGGDGATTVAGTIRAAALAGLRFMATGGIGGVHRGHPEDVSADLAELARSPVAVFCAGAKLILDIPATLERLESLAVPVIGFTTDEFPAFYTARSGCRLSFRAEDPAAVARILDASWHTGGAGLVVAIPPPEELAGAWGLAEQALSEESGAGGGGGGGELTPRLLARIAELSGGRSVEVNVSLVVHNAEVAAQVAVAWSAAQR
jgi:pseudouridine-5'-phosphate glycosidase